MEPPRGPSPSDPSPSDPGPSELGPYELLGELARGAQATVHRARHRPTGALRALKVLEGSRDPESVERFRREAVALARVGGPGVVVVHEVGVDRGRLWLALDLLEGGSLRGRLDRAGPLPWRAAAALVAGLARTLERCAAAGLVHRDLKPENVLFSLDGTRTLDWGEARVADFGVARDLHASRLTETGSLLGTPGYAAPEQLRGEPAGAAADVFALGVVLYEAVTGSRPYEETSVVALWRAQESGRFVRASARAAAPPGLDAVLARALAPRAADRPTAGQLAAALESLVAGKGAASASPRRALGIGVGLAALVALGVTGLGAVGPGPATGAASASPPAPSAAPSPGASPSRAARDPGLASPSPARKAPEAAGRDVDEALAALAQDDFPRARNRAGLARERGAAPEDLARISDAALARAVAVVRSATSFEVEPANRAFRASLGAVDVARAAVPGTLPPQELGQLADELRKNNRLLGVRDLNLELDIVSTAALASPYADDATFQLGKSLHAAAQDPSVDRKRLAAVWTEVRAHAKTPNGRAELDLAWGDILRTSRPPDLAGAEPLLRGVLEEHALPPAREARAALSLADLLVARGKLEEAYRALDVPGEPAVAKYYVEQGWLALRLDRKRQAVAALERGWRALEAAMEKPGADRDRLQAETRVLTDLVAALGRGDDAGALHAFEEALRSP